MDQNSTPSSSPSISLLPNFLSIDQIQNLPSKDLKDQIKINVVGFVKDFQPPIRSRGTDFKCTFEIVDASIPYGLLGLKVHIFRPERDMPKIEGVGDVALIRNAKVQMYAGGVSAMTNWATEIHLLPASKIPTDLSWSINAAWQSYPPNKCKVPTASEIAYIVSANKYVEDLALPSTMEFQDNFAQAMNVKDRFALLKDVRPQCFYDLLGQVIQVHEGSSYERVTVYISDYTANSGFYHYTWGGAETARGRDGDEHGYIKSRPKAAKDWPGPFGKLSIQLTLYDGHASFVREQVKLKDWILLRNVQIKYGNNGGHLEGFLRGDRQAFEGKVQVQVMKQSKEPDENDSRWREAVARKCQWEKKFKQEKQELLNEVDGKKRKREDDPPKFNSKARRKERRAAAKGKVAAIELKHRIKLDLNNNIRCSNPDKPTALLADILKQRKLMDETRSRQYLSPFDVRCYKANVQVVDYFPPKIEDFAVGRRPSEFDILSDYSGDEDTDLEEEMRSFRTGKRFTEKNWEWRFALEVVDAGKKPSQERMWLVVSNYDAQMLLNMDATNLRRDKDAFHQVKEQLYLLWGDLEEQKSALAGDLKLYSFEEKSSPPPSSRKPGDQPPTDSDCDDDSLGGEVKKVKTKSDHPASLSEQNLNLRTKVPGRTSSAELQIKNKAFTCCIKQYGVKIKESDLSLASAGNGKRWERKFGLFGTRIV